MAEYVFVVYSNPVKGREDEYNDWYSNQHLSDLLVIPGIVSAKRFVLSDTQASPSPQSYHYMSIYNIETGDPQGIMNELISRAGTSRMVHSTALSSDTSAVFWEAL